MLAISDKISELQQQFDTTTNQHMRRVYNEQIAGLQQELNGLRGDMQEQVAYRGMSGRKRKLISTFKELLYSKKPTSSQVAAVTDRTALFIRNATGQEVQTGAAVELTSNNAKHIHKRHIANPEELNPLTDSDIANISEVIEDPDTVMLGNFTHGRQRIQLKKQIDKSHTAVVEVIKKGNALNVVTYFNDSPYRRPDALRPQDVRPSRNDSTNLNNTIANNPRIVKGKRFRPEAAGSYFETRTEAHRQNVDKVTNQPQLQKKVRQLVLSS